MNVRAHSVWLNLTRRREEDLRRLKHQASALHATIRALKLLAGCRRRGTTETPDNIIPIDHDSFRLPSEYTDQEILDALISCQGNTVKAAAMLGVKYRSLHMAIIGRRIKTAYSRFQISGDAGLNTSQLPSKL